MDNKMNGYIKELNDYHIQFENIHMNYLTNFYNEAEELVIKSNGKFQIEDSIRLNMISVKGYILESDIVKQFNTKDFNLFELKNYLNQINNDSKNDVLLAIKIYELLEDMEKNEENDIHNSAHYIQIITDTFFEDKLEDKNNLNMLYNNLLNKINEYKNNKVVNDEQCNILVNCLNALFNYYLNGSRKIVNNNI